MILVRNLSKSDLQLLENLSIYQNSVKTRHLHIDVGGATLQQFIQYKSNIGRSKQSYNSACEISFRIILCASCPNPMLLVSCILGWQQTQNFCIKIADAYSSMLFFCSQNLVTALVYSRNAIYTLQENFKQNFFFS